MIQMSSIYLLNWQKIFTNFIYSKNSLYDCSKKIFLIFRTKAWV